MAMMLYRALIKTHHMTSRTKIRAVVQAAKKCHCAVYIKTGKHPPGVMIAECDQGEGYLKEWLGSVKVSIAHSSLQEIIIPENSRFLAFSLTRESYGNSD